MESEKIMNILELADMVKGVLEGDARSQYEMARRHLVGVGADEIESEAFRLALLSANQDYAPAVLLLARCYRFGWGTEKSKEKAIECYKKAVKLGNTIANEELLEIK